MISISTVTLADAKEIFRMASKLSMTFDVNGKHEIADFERVLQDDSAIFLIARLENNTVAYLYGNIHYAFYSASNIALIEELYVCEGFRGKGIATELVKRAEQIAIKNNGALMSVSTRRAEAFYEKCGYQRSAQYLRKLL